MLLFFSVVFVQTVPRHNYSPQSYVTSILDLLKPYTYQLPDNFVSLPDPHRLFIESGRDEDDRSGDRTLDNDFSKEALLEEMVNDGWLSHPLAWKSSAT
jgi:hypothetical protein